VLRLYFDEDSLNPAVIDGLARVGFDCLTCAEAGNRALADERQLEFAAGLGRVLFTQNTDDFALIHRRWSSEARIHAGIIALTDQRTLPGVQIRAVQRIAELYDEAAGLFIYLLNFA
jgi:hypothetical protein